jgi:hypothetical protein
MDHDEPFIMLAVYHINTLQKDMITDCPKCTYHGCNIVDVINRNDMPK